MRLKQVLISLVAKANRQPGIIHQARLKHGLEIRIHTHPLPDGFDRIYHLSLHRPLVWPSDQEWQTVFKHWPDPKPDPIPDYSKWSHPEKDHGYFLGGSFKLPEQQNE